MCRVSLYVEYSDDAPPQFRTAFENCYTTYVQYASASSYANYIGIGIAGAAQGVQLIRPAMLTNSAIELWLSIIGFGILFFALFINLFCKRVAQRAEKKLDKYFEENTAYFHKKPSLTDLDGVTLFVQPQPDANALKVKFKKKL